MPLSVTAFENSSQGSILAVLVSFELPCRARPNSLKSVLWPAGVGARARCQRPAEGEGVGLQRAPGRRVVAMDLGSRRGGLVGVSLAVDEWGALARSASGVRPAGAGAFGGARNGFPFLPQYGRWSNADRCAKALRTSTHRAIAITMVVDLCVAVAAGVRSRRWRFAPEARVLAPMS